MISLMITLTDPHLKMIVTLKELKLSFFYLYRNGFVHDVRSDFTVSVVLHLSGRQSGQRGGGWLGGQHIVRRWESGLLSSRSRVGRMGRLGGWVEREIRAASRTGSPRIRVIRSVWAAFPVIRRYHNDDLGLVRITWGRKRPNTGRFGEKTVDQNEPGEPHFVG